jgi:hypothetical protein
MRREEQDVLFTLDVIKYTGFVNAALMLIIVIALILLYYKYFK